MHSLAMRVTAFFLRRRSPENFQNFLKWQKSGRNIPVMLTESMGYHEIIITAEKAISYAGEAETVRLLSASIECRAVVKMHNNL